MMSAATLRVVAAAPSSAIIVSGASPTARRQAPGLAAVASRASQQAAVRPEARPLVASLGKRQAVNPLKAYNTQYSVNAFSSNGPVDVTVVLGSRSDLPIAEKCIKVLEQFGLNYQLRVASAHRAPVYLEGIITSAEANGCKVFIGMAGVAAALPGVIASMTGKPVIGVPCGGKVPYDSLLSIVQMPPGMPVATVGTDRGDNAGVLAVQILAAFDPVLAQKFKEYRTNMTNNVIADDEKTVQEYSRNTAGFWN
mmetsp:Transcript_7943/g.22759  ORF Transcript_7943/g.22759 Transcript_7943/m.22759 type:complete len:253 (-) Transcript_7943:168-926(-)